MKHFTIKSLLLPILLVLFSLSSCDKHDHDDHDHGVPGEMTITLTDTSDVTKKLSFKWSDMDGAGGANPIIDTMKLQSGKFYTCAITVKDTENKDLTSEILNEGYEHQFFYGTANLAENVFIAITDKDKNNIPIGLQFTTRVFPLSTSENIKTGTLNVVLSHYDDVKKDGVTRSPESDIDVTFPVVISK
jgi:hypothetical protein